MAFLDLTRPSPAAGTAFPLPVDQLAPKPFQQEAAIFSSEEWQIIRHARHDGLTSLRPVGRWDRLMKAVFGFRRVTALASRRLEALRRLAVDSWHHGYAVSPAYLKAFLRAGFSEAQLELMLGAISAARFTLARRRFR